MAQKNPGNWHSYSTPNDRPPKTLFEVGETKHLDFSVTEGKRPEDDTMSSYHVDELPTSLADRIKFQGFNLITHNPDYTIGKSTFENF